MQPQTHHPLSCRSGCRHAAPPHPITKSTNPSAHLHPLFPPNSALLELMAVLRSSRTAWASGFSTPHLSPPLFQKGVFPSSIEEATGILGVEQNRIVVAAKVRDSLVQSNFDPLEKEKVTERLRRDGEEEVPGLVDSYCSPLEKSSCRGKVDAVHHCSTLLSTLLHDE
ncbi:hypothetical protein NE237_007558 [Protea cynaroides]|uniref:Rubisco accumulation factor 1 helix turn helix domain-containing protein n=1 Tax=Protea cynaroides TaxID=273540 RepID=A0A9Q0QWM0_9MAGN|nr:hypothetical protein NE237_007558 [Protea cynaroides]